MREHKYELAPVVWMLVLVGLFLAALFELLTLVHFTPVSKDALRQLFVADPDGFRPKPYVQACYVAGVLLLPLLCLFLNKIALINFQGSLARRGALALIAALTIQMIAGAVSTTEGWFVWYGCSDLITMLTGLLLIVLFMRGGCFASGMVFWLYVAAATVLVLYSGVIRSDGDIGGTTAWHHFSAYSYSVSQVYAGKDLLAEFTNQYGLYPYLLLPLFKITGLSSGSLTLTLLMMKALTLILFAAVFWLNIRNKAVAVAGFGALVWYSFMHAVAMNGIEYKDLYFQYNPHRLFFAAVFMTVLTLYVRCPERRKTVKYWLLTMICALAVVWNVESGMILLITWLVIYPYVLFLNGGSVKCVLKNSLLHVFRVIAVLLAAFAAIAAVVYSRSGLWPDFVEAFAAQRLFGAYGYFMLPLKMSPLQPWGVMLVCYAAALCFGIRQISACSNAAKSQIIMIVCAGITGFGVFPYYLGRAHFFNLDAVIWPLLLLTALYLDRVAGSMKCSGVRQYAKKFPATALLAGAAFVFLASATGNSVDKAADYYDSMSYRDGQFEQIYEDNLKVIQQAAPADHQMLIISMFDYYLGSGLSNPVNAPGFSELVLRRDHQLVLKYLENNKTQPVAYDETPLQFTPEYFSEYRHILEKRYHVIFAGQYMKIWLPDNR